MTGGASLWRANWSERDDPFAHVAAARPERAQARGPGWQRAQHLQGGYDPTPARVREARGSAVSLGNKGRDDIAIGSRVFHQKFGHGEVVDQEGNKLEIEFDKAGRKRVLDSFVTVD